MYEAVEGARTIRIIYKHSHDCQFKGAEFVYYPSTRDGVALLERPLCVETMTELSKLRTEHV